MRIAVIYPSLGSVGGAENVVIWIAESLAMRGHEVVIFTRAFSESVWGTLAEKPYVVHLLNFQRSRSTLKTNAAAGAALAKALLLHPCDVINAHNYPTSLWVYYAKQQMHACPPLLIYLHNLPNYFYERQISPHYCQLPGLRNFWYRYRPKKLFRSLRQAMFHYRRLDQEAMLAADRVLANSHYTAVLARDVYGVDVLPCPLGVPVELFCCNGKSTRQAVSGKGTSMILTVARIELQKNFDTILMAVALLKNRGINGRFRYVVAGGGPQLSYFRSKSRKMGLDSVIQFLGSVPHEEMDDLYAGAAFLVHIPLDEPFGLVPVEAALCKKASIVSDHGGPAEIVINNYSGLHVDALNAEDVASKVEYLLDNEGIAIELGLNAYDNVVKNMRWDSFIDKLIVEIHALV